MSELALAVDVVVFSLEPAADGGCAPLILTVQRRNPPYADRPALPGAMLATGEELEAAARRALRRAAGLQEVRHLEQLATFGDRDRDPRGRVVTVAYLGLLPEPSPLDSGTWHRVSEVPELAFDHDEVLALALDRLRGKLSYSNVAYGLLPDRFTLSELQAAYEAFLDRELDKRNFRKKVLAAGMLEQAPGMRRGPHRPAQLYRFPRLELELLDTVISG